MDRDQRLWLDDPDFRKAWSLSTGRLAEAAAQVLLMFLALGVVVGFQITDGVEIVALAVVRSPPTPSRERDRIRCHPRSGRDSSLRCSNLCAAATGYAVLALPNFFFA